MGFTSKLMMKLKNFGRKDKMMMEGDSKMAAVPMMDNSMAAKNDTMMSDTMAKPMMEDSMSKPMMEDSMSKPMMEDHMAMAKPMMNGSSSMSAPMMDTPMTKPMMDKPMAAAM